MIYIDPKTLDADYEEIPDPFVPEGWRLIRHRPSGQFFYTTKKKSSDSTPNPQHATLPPPTPIATLEYRMLRFQDEIDAKHGPLSQMPKTKCECGVAKVGGIHSSWCPVG